MNLFVCVVIIIAFVVASVVATVYIMRRKYHHDFEFNLSLIGSNSNEKSECSKEMFREVLDLISTKMGTMIKNDGNYPLIANGNVLDGGGIHWEWNLSGKSVPPWWVSQDNMP